MSSGMNVRVRLLGGLCQPRDRDQPWVKGDATVSPLGPPSASLTLGKARLPCPAWRPSSPLSQPLPQLLLPLWPGFTEL